MESVREFMSCKYNTGKGKGSVHPRTGHEDTEGGADV